MKKEIFLIIVCLFYAVITFSQAKIDSCYESVKKPYIRSTHSDMLHYTRIQEPTIIVKTTEFWETIPRYIHIRLANIVDTVTVCINGEKSYTFFHIPYNIGEILKKDSNYQNKMLFHIYKTENNQQWSAHFNGQFYAFSFKPINKDTTAEVILKFTSRKNLCFRFNFNLKHSGAGVLYNEQGEWSLYYEDEYVYPEAYLYKKSWRVVKKRYRQFLKK